MSRIEQYIESLQFHNRIIKGKTDGFTHEDSMRQLPFPGNCMNWNLGHLLVYRERKLGLLDGQTTPDENEFGLYGFGSEQLTDSEIATPLESILTRLEKTSDAIITALKEMPPEKLDEVIDEERGITLAKRLNFYILFHEAYHIGQLEILHELGLAQK